MEPKRIKTKAMCVVFREDGTVLATPGFDAVKNERFARILGGNIEFGETAEEALRREFREELNTELVDPSFVQVVENLFTFEGEQGHEIIFIYTGELADADMYKRETMPVLDTDAVATWISLEDVERGVMNLYPRINYRSLQKKARM